MNESRLQLIIDAQTLGFQRGIAEASRGLKALRAEHGKTVISSKALERATRDLTRELDRQSRSLEVLTLRWRAVRDAMLTVATRTAVTGFAALASSVAALGAGLVEVTGSLTGFVAALTLTSGVGLASIAQGATVAGLALDGVGKALTTTGKEHEKALEKLTKPARAFVKELDSMRDAYREIKLLAQEGLFTGLTHAVVKAKPLLEPFKQTVYDTATTLGYLAEQLAEMAASRKADLGAIGQRNVITLRRMGDSAIYAGEAMIDVLRAADPLIGHISRGWVTFTRNMRDAARESRANGGMASFFHDLRVSYDQWTDVLGNLGRALAGLWQAQVDPSRELMEKLDGVTERWADFTNSEAGQKKLTAFFRSSNKVLESMAGFAGELVSMFARLSIVGSDNAVRLFDTLRESFLPVIEKLAVAFNRDLFPALLDFSESFGEFFAAVEPGLETFSRITASFLGVVSALVGGIGDLTSFLPPLPRALASLAIGAGVLAGWGKLALAIKLAVFEMRRFIGLAPEIAGSSAAARAMLFQRGGRNQGAEGGGARGTGLLFGGNSPGRRATASAGAPFLRPSAGLPASTINTILGNSRDAAIAAGLSKAASRRPPLRGPSTPFTVRAARGPRVVQRAPDGTPYPLYTGPGLGMAGGARSSYATRVRGRANPNLSPARTVKPIGAARARYDAALQQGVVGLGSRRLKIADNIADGTRKGLELGAKAAAPVLKGTIGFAAVSGLISGLGSSESGLQSKLKDALSGATFGLLDTAAQERSKAESSLRGALSGNKFDPLKAAKNFDNAAAMKGTLEGAKLVNGKLDLVDPASKARFDAYIDKLREGGRITDDFAGKAKALATAIKQQGDAYGRASFKVEGFDKIDAALASFGKLGDAARDSGDRVVQALDAVSKSGGGSLRDIERKTQDAASTIRRELGGKSEAGRKALATNYRLAADAVRDQMARAGKSTKAGTDRIQRYLEMALVELGLGSREKARNYLNSSTGDTAGKGEAGTSGSGQGAARGKLMKLPGGIGPDSIPMQVAGRKIVAAPGEDVAIVNRHQRRFLDQRLADVGGFGGMFSAVNTPHHHSGPGFAKGGLIDLKGARPGLAPYARDAARYDLVVSSGLRPGSITSSGNLSNHSTGNALDLFGSSANMLRFGLHAAKDYGAQLEELIHTPMGFGIKNGKRVPPYAAEGHYDHVHLADTGVVGKLVGAALAAMPRVKGATSGIGGALGGGINKGLATIRSAAQARLKKLYEASGAGVELPSGSGAGGGATSAGGTFTKAMLVDLWTQAGGAPDMANLMAAIALAESSGNPGITNSIGARGLWQIMPGTARGFGFDYSLMTNPLMNARAAVAILKGQGLGAWEAYTRGMHAKFMTLGGMLQGRAKIPTRNDGVPSVDTSDAVTSGGGGTKKKKAKAKKPNIKTPSYPNLSAIKKKGGGTFTPKVGKRARKLLGPMRESAPAFVQNWAALLGDGGLLAKRVGSLTNRASALADLQSLTEEQFIVSMPDGTEVLNTDGVTVDGKFIPGIAQAVAEWVALRDTYYAPILALQQQRAELVAAIPSRLKPQIAQHQGRLAVIDEILSHDQREENADAAELKKERAKAGTWQDRVATNDAKIKRLRDYKKSIRTKGIGATMTDEARRALARADGDISALQTENKRLKKVKPKAGKGSAERASRLTRSILIYQHRRDYLGRGREGIAGDLNDLLGLQTDNTDLLAGLREVEIPAASFNILQLNKLIGDAQGTTPPKPGSSARDEALASLLKDQNETLLRESAIREAQFGVLSGFAPLVGQRLVGAFAHGTPSVPRDGLALVHKNEAIIPAEQGPFRNRAAEARAGGGVTQLELVLTGDMVGLMKRIDARVDGQAVKVVSKQLGRKQRVLTSAPGG